MTHRILEDQLDLSALKAQFSTVVKLAVEIGLKNTPAYIISLMTTVLVSELNYRSSALVYVASRMIVILACGVPQGANSYLKSCTEERGIALKVTGILSLLFSLFMMTSYFWLPPLLVLFNQNAVGIAYLRAYLKWFEASLLFVTLATVVDQPLIIERDWRMIRIMAFVRLFVELGIMLSLFYLVKKSIDDTSIAYLAHAIFYSLFTSVYILKNTKYAHYHSDTLTWQLFCLHAKKLIKVCFPYALRLSLNLVAQFGVTLIAGAIGADQQQAYNIMMQCLNCVQFIAVTALTDALSQASTKENHERNLANFLPKQKFCLWLCVITLVTGLYGLLVSAMLVPAIKTFIVGQFLKTAGVHSEASVKSYMTDSNFTMVALSQYSMAINMITAGGSLLSENSAGIPLLINLFGYSLCSVGVPMLFYQFAALSFTQLLVITALSHVFTAATMSSYNMYKLFVNSEQQRNVESDLESQPLLAN